MMRYTPVIPPLPSPEGGSSPAPNPPVIPVISPPHGSQPLPNWMRAQQAAQQGAFPAGAYMQTPGQTPYLAVPGSAPGSYFIPPVALPPQGTPGTPMAPLGANGFSADFTGYPHIVNGPPTGTPWQPAGNFQQQPPGGGQPAGGPPPTGYMGYQPLPMGMNMGMGMGAMGGMGGMGGMGMGAMPMGTMGVPSWAIPAWGGAAGMATPFAPPGAIPGAWPPSTPYQQAGAPPGFGAPPLAPSASGGPPASQAHRPLRAADGLDRFDKFDVDPAYGPVLDEFIVKVVKARLELNPLLGPPPDNPDSRPYLKWNMLFPTAQCQRSSDPGHRSWAEGRDSPATWPRVKSLRILSRAFPWEMHVVASDPELGVTCGDVIESVHTFMYGRVSSQQLDNAAPAHKRLVGQSYWHNRSTAHGVPGGRLYNTLLRCDWLGLQTMFGGLVEGDERLIKDVACGAALPCTFELKCVQRYPMTEAEIREHEAREALAREDEERRQRRAARSSRNTSRATSRASSRVRQSQNTTTSDDSDEN